MFKHKVKEKIIWRLKKRRHVYVDYGDYSEKMWDIWNFGMHSKHLDDNPDNDVEQGYCRLNQIIAIKLNYCSKLFLTIKSFKNKLYYLHRALVDRMAKHEYQPS